MATDTGQKFRDALGALMGDGADATEQALIDALTTITYRAQRGTYSLANVDPSAAGGAWTATLDDNTAVRMQLQYCKITVDNAVTAANTDTTIWSLVYNNGNGGSDTTVATINSATTAGGGSGNITAQVPLALTINTTNQNIPANSQLQFKLTKGGSGVGSGSLSVVAKFKPV